MSRRLTPEQRDALEQRIHEAHDDDRMEDAATAAIEGYGPEILGFLMGLLRDEVQASEVFSIFCEDLWGGIADFSWQASFRTWAYVLARNARSRYLRNPARRREQRLPTERERGLAARVRDATLPWLRTEVKDRVAELRQNLDPDDQELLILRIDRAMSWKEVASVIAPELSGKDLSRKAAALRKRFERVKEQLRVEALQAGLIPR